MIKTLNLKKINQKLDSYCYYCYYWAVLSFRKTKKAIGVSCHSDLKISVGSIIKLNKNMRNFLLSALACVAFAGSGFASNEVVSEIAEIKTVTTSVEETADSLLGRNPCEFNIWVEDENGNQLDWWLGSGPEGGYPCIQLAIATL